MLQFIIIIFRKYTNSDCKANIIFKNVMEKNYYLKVMDMDRNDDLNLSDDELLRLSQIYLYENNVKGIEDPESSSNYENEINVNVDIKIKNYCLKSISKSPMGFLGVHRYLLIDIIYRLDPKENEYKKYTVRLFVKLAPKGNPSRMMYIEEFGVFRKEIVCYRDVLPKLEGVLFNSPISAKCFHTKGDALILEDLTQKGYKLASKRDGLLDYNHMKCVMKTLAKLHASSLIHEIENGAAINEMYQEAVKENAYPEKALNCDTHVRHQNVRQAIKVSQALIECMPRYEQSMNMIMLELPKKVWRIYEFVQASKTYRNVFSHGDLWANNIMFQYDKNNQPTQCRFIDFQLTRYAPPVIDLITILTIPTNRQFRERHLSDLVQQYYLELRNLLRSKNLQMDNILPQDEFYQTFKEFRMCGLIESLLFSHMTILPEDLANKLTSTADGFNDFFKHQRTEICLSAFHKDPIYRERLSDMLEDLVDNYILINENN